MPRTGPPSGGADEIVHSVLANGMCSAPPALFVLPEELLLVAFVLLDAPSLARLASTCTALFYPETSPVAVALCYRAAMRGRTCNGPLPVYATSWSLHLAWTESRYEEARRRVTGGLMCSFVVTGGRLLSCGIETRLSPGLLGRRPVIAGDSRPVTKLLPVPSMRGIYVNSVTTEFGHGCAVTACGAVYTWGNRHLGRVGDDGMSDPPIAPTKVDGLSKFRILSVSAGGNHCLAVAVTGEVFAWGIAIDGLCGNGQRAYYQAMPAQIRSLGGTRIRSASAGNRHSLVVAENGAIYSFGRGVEGQLGHRGTQNEHIPRRVRALRHVRVISAAAGGTSSLALASDGSVFEWGSDDYGGICATAPRKLQELNGVRVSSIIAHGEGRGAVASTGEVFTWGRRPAGLLGHGIGVTEQRSPRRIDALRCEWVDAVSFGSMHTIVVTRGGDVIGWGDVDLLGLDGGSSGGGTSVSMPMVRMHVTCEQ